MWGRMFFRARILVRRAYLTFLNRLLCLASVCVVLSTSAARAQEFDSQMVGGQYVDLSSSHVAFVSTADGECSGVLVGAKEVLTAAHCISGVPEDYSVLVGGRVYSASDAWYHSWYQEGGDVSANAPYDLGLIELSQPVTGASPLPVLIDLPVSVGDSLVMAGYGTNEISGMTDAPPWENGKIGALRVTSREYGVFSSEHATGGASTCAGDSGGPAIRTLGPYIAVVGTLSNGTNKVIGGSCFEYGGGKFSYVDLQSPASRGFLSFFPGVQYLSAKPVVVNLTASKSLNDVTKALKSKDIKKFKKTVASIRSGLSVVVPYSSGQRRTLLSAALTKLKRAAEARTLKQGLIQGRAAKAQLTALVALGVQ